MISSDWQNKIFLKKVRGSNLGPTDLNQAQNKTFCHFLWFESLVLLEIAYNDSLSQFITFNRGKTCEKNILGPKFAIFSSFAC